MESWIVQMVRTRCLRRVVAWGLALGCAVWFGFAQQRYIANFIMGPFGLGPAELESITSIDKAPQYFAKVTGSDALDTGIQQLTIHKNYGVETSREVSGGYYALVVGDKFLVYKSSTGRQTTVEGELAPMPADVQGYLFQTPEMQAIRNRFYPFYVSDDSFRLPGYFAIAGVLVFIFLLIKQGVPAWRYLHDPKSHPVVTRVNSWGDPVGIATEAERDARSPLYKSSGWAITDKYLVQSTFFTFNLLRLLDLLWAYKKVTRHSVNFIPTGKTYDAVLICYGGAGTIKGPEKAVDALLGFAAQRVPWAVFGFTKELEALFKKNTREFCTGVEQRKHEWMQKVASSS